jgi:hypothetical protein
MASTPPGRRTGTERIKVISRILPALIATLPKGGLSFSIALSRGACQQIFRPGGTP